MENTLSNNHQKSRKPTVDYSVPDLSKTEGIRIDFLRAGEPIPTALEALRQAIYVDEMNFSDAPFYENDTICDHVLLYQHGELIGAVAVAPANRTDFNNWAHADPSKIGRSVFGTRALVKSEYRKSGYYKMLLYSCFSRYRRQGISRMVAFSEEMDSASKHVMDMTKMINSEKRNVGEYNVECYESDIDYIMYRALERSSLPIKKFLLATEAVAELDAYTKLRLSQFYEGDFYKSVVNGTLTKQTYIESLAHTHCYVKWTTRILARQLCNLTDKGFFKEITQHLMEEIGHPEMVIDNMRSCGASEYYIDYVLNGMVPNKYIDRFMSAQESAVSFREDPVAFMGIPIAIEGITAFMPKEFAKGLELCANRWGIQNPKEAISFWCSHIVFDNPVNGHWARTMKIIGKSLESEAQVVQIRNHIDNVIDSISRGYNDTVCNVLS